MALGVAGGLAGAAVGRGRASDVVRGTGGCSLHSSKLVNSKKVRASSLFKFSIPWDDVAREVPAPQRSCTFSDDVECVLAE